MDKKYESWISDDDRSNYSIPIPKEVIDILDLDQFSTVEITIVDGKLVMEFIKQ